MNLLIDLMNLGPIGVVAVVRTSDGNYLGQVPDDLGYNLFLGRPSPSHPGPGRSRSRRVWAAFTPAQRASVLRHASAPLDGYPIPLTDFLGPEPWK